mmetsp:Transcript_54001/g.137139  ORF Transcript_54001/g.137139 Transcript_54001/m.137139 type:complete len:531 (+) Transcript_54001:65-1657(+)
MSASDVSGERAAVVEENGKDARKMLHIRAVDRAGGKSKKSEQVPVTRGDDDQIPPSDAVGEGAPLDPDQPVTTLMFRNLPRKYTALALTHELEGSIDLDALNFVYLPWDTSAATNMGYAFVNFVDPENATLIIGKLDGQPWRLVHSFRPVKVVPAHVQGLQANLVHCAHKIPPDADKAHCPLVYHDGKQIDFRTAVRLYGRPKSAAGQAHKLAQQQRKAQQKMLQDQQRQCKLERMQQPQQQQQQQHLQQDHQQEQHPPPQQMQRTVGLQVRCTREMEQQFQSTHRQQQQLVEQHVQQPPQQCQQASSQQLSQQQSLQQQDLKLRQQMILEELELLQQQQRQQQHMECQRPLLQDMQIFQDSGHAASDQQHVIKHGTLVARTPFSSLSTEATMTPELSSLRKIGTPSVSECASWPGSVFTAGKAKPLLGHSNPHASVPHSHGALPAGLVMPPNSSLMASASDWPPVGLESLHGACAVEQQSRHPQSQKLDADEDVEARQVVASDAYRAAWSKTNEQLMSLLQSGSFSISA